MFFAGASILIAVFVLAAIPATRNAIDRNRILTRIAGFAVMAALSLMAGSFITLLWRVMP